MFAPRTGHGDDFFVHHIEAYRGLRALRARMQNFLHVAMWRNVHCATCDVQAGRYRVQ